MSGSRLTKFAMWIQSLKTPAWLRGLLDILWYAVVVPTLKEIGKAGCDLIREKIVYAAGQPWTGQEKLNYVKEEFLLSFGGTNLRERVLNRGIELLLGEIDAAGATLFSDPE